MKSREIKFAILILSVLLIASLIFSGAFKTLDNYTYELKFKLRGEIPIDSTTIILYLDNDDINALGGLPLKRNYYALAINILNELNAKVIGLDVALTKYSIDKPEYDELLIKNVVAKKNVVLTSYFDVISEEEPNLTSRLPENLGYKSNSKTKFFSGEKLNLPFPELIQAAYSIGHENLTEDGKIPLFVNQANGLMPAFAFELFRAFTNIEKENIEFQDSKVIIKSNLKTYTIPLEDNGVVNLNYTGGAKTLLAIPLVEFLQAYNLHKKGGITDINVNCVKDKIVIIGIVASGRSLFVRSPFSSQYPAVGLHATFIDNVFHNRFITSTPKIVEFLLIVIACLAFSYLGFKGNELKIFIILLIYFLIYLIVAFVCFLIFNFDLTITRHFIILFFQMTSITIYRNYLTKEKMYHLEAERDSIRKKLHDREEKLIKLQNELKKAELENALQKKGKLVDEIKKYEREVGILKLQIDEYEKLAEFPDKYENFEGIIYSESSPMKDIVEFLKKIADNNAPVLILGESGTGKELIARAIHRKSSRANKPFIALNCGALTETLLESELFGYEKGAFTGATKEKPGRFELADGGTIFLDEIAETSESFQVKLLRILQEGEFERVGGTETKKVDVRVVAATNKNISNGTGEKKFRQDLYYRLSVFVINLPPLRERKLDIPILIKHFIDQENKSIKCSNEVIDLLSKYTFPGNVRELQSIIKRAVVLATADKREYIRISDLPEEIQKLQKSKEDFAENIINSIRSKNFSKNSISETAKELGGINRSTVAEYLRGYCFKTFVEKNFDLKATIIEIAGSTDNEIINRANKKFIEYLQNALENIDKNSEFESNLAKSKSKFKNLPQKYHFYLEEIIKNYLKGEFTVNPSLDDYDSGRSSENSGS